MSATRERSELRLPYALIPTNLPDAFTSPVPSPNFDPRTASASSLLKHGFLWRRPGKGDSPALRGTWERLIRHWGAEGYLVPQLEPQLGKTHVLRGARRASDGSFISSNWAGATVGGNWTSAVGVWGVPTVSEPLIPQGTEGGWNSSSWVGLDGVYGSDDVLQAGVEQRVSASGAASYVAWFEWFTPAQPDSPPYVFQTNITNFPVRPGDTVFCSVQYVSGHTAGDVFFANFTTGQRFSITLAPPPGATFSGNSAEWIMEAPDGGIPISSLPTFSPVVFTDAFCCDANQMTGNPAGGDIWNIEGFGRELTSVTVGDLTCIIDDLLAVAVPDVLGMNTKKAVQVLESWDLVPEFSETPADHSWVSSQSPLGGTIVDLGSTVKIQTSNLAPQ